MSTLLRRFSVTGLLISSLGGSAALAQTRPPRMYDVSPRVYDYRTQREYREYRDPKAPYGYSRLGFGFPQGPQGIDFIEVPSLAGGFSQLVFQAQGGRTDISNILVYHDGGQIWRAQLRLQLDGPRHFGVDVPGTFKDITGIQYRYYNATGRPQVEVVGRQTESVTQQPAPGWGWRRQPVPPPPGRPPGAWNPSGWDRLGETTVDGWTDRDVLRVGAREGAFTSLMLVADGSDVELYDMTVQFANGERYSVPAQMSLREGQRTGAIDLPGNARTIQAIQFRYGDLAGSGRARLEVYGRQGR